jgi:hypothetical protein
MGIEERIACYKAIEEYRKRPLIIYVTSTRLGVNAMMAGDSVREFIDQIDLIKESKEVDVLIHSTGGDALTAWKLMSLLRERFDKIGVLVPQMAFSAATIFALGADEIVMHPHASLGPIDPQIIIRTGEGKERHFAFEDVGAFLRFLDDEVGLTEQQYISAIVDKLFTAVDPVNVGAAKRASELSTQVGERLLQMHMKTSEEKANAHSIAERLNKSFFAHGDAVSRTRARELQLKIAKNDNNLESLIWSAFLKLEEYLEMRKPFNPLHHFIANGGEESLKPTPPLVLPPNSPSEVIGQTWTIVAQQALAKLSNPGIEVPYSIINAIIESERQSCEFRSSGTISAARLGGGEIQISLLEKEASWRKLQH